MSDSKDTNIRSWVLTIGILLILAIVGLGILWVVQDMLNQAKSTLQPVNDISQNLGTQMAQVLHPTPTIIPDPVTIIRQVRSLSRLETIQYSVEKVITAETGQGTFGFLFGDRLLFVAHGTVIAGVDLAKMGPDDLQVQDGVLYVRVPEAEIFIATLDNEKSYVYERDTGVLRKSDINLETEARRAAEQEIANAALEDGILDQARQNAENYLYRLFISLGYRDVIFVDSPAPE